MYHDKVTVCRQINTIDEEGADDYAVRKLTEIFLANYIRAANRLPYQNTDRQVGVTTDLKLFLPPQYDILPNDILKISHNGQDNLLNRSKIV